MASLLLIDTMGLIFRAHYALVNNPLRTKAGEPTSAISGVCRMIFRSLREHKPDYIVCALDSKEPTWRHEIFSSYKANRIEPPEDLKIQIPQIIELLKALSFPVVQKSGWEADDIIATICNKLEAIPELNIKILSNDKDLLQLVTEKVHVVQPVLRSDVTKKMDTEAVKLKWGVSPQHIRDLLALTGDASDNIPGVPGIGIKTATALLGDFDGLNEIYSHIGEDLDVPRERDKRLTASVYKKLFQGHEDAMLSFKLITLDHEIDMECDLKSYEVPERFDHPDAVTLLKKYELKQILHELHPSVDSPPLLEEEPPPQVRALYTTLDTYEKVSSYLDEIKDAKWIAVDTETTSLDAWYADLLGISMSAEPGTGIYIPVGHLDVPEMTWKRLFPIIEPFLCKYESKLCMHNGKYDITILSQNGINLSKIGFDSIIAASILFISKSRPLSMDDLAREVLDYHTIPYSDMVKKPNLTLRDVDIEKVTQYAGEDADITLRFCYHFNDMINEQNMKGLFEDLDMPLLMTLFRMEKAGIIIDTDEFSKMSHEIAEEMIKIEDEIHHEVGYEPNLNSPKQLQHLLFEKMMLPPIRKTRTGYSTEESVLEQLAVYSPIPAKILEYRGLGKLRGTYLDPLPQMINPKTGRIHTQFSQIRTSTGRLSSSNPNLQNIPIRGERGKRVRRCFKASPGADILRLDYNQMELRILAHYSQDEALMKVYEEGGDLHMKTACALYKRQEADISSDERSSAKTINFSVVYGVGAHSLARQLSIPYAQARDFVKSYEDAYPGFVDFRERLFKKAHEDGYVETLFGRRRWIAELGSKNKIEQAYGQRMALNTPIQGTAADILRKVMIDIDGFLSKEKLKTQMLLQVHDELIFDVPYDERDTVIAAVRKISECKDFLSVPLVVGLGIGETWGAAAEHTGL